MKSDTLTHLDLFFDNFYRTGKAMELEDRRRDYAGKRYGIENYLAYYLMTGDPATLSSVGNMRNCLINISKEAILEEVMKHIVVHYATLAEHHYVQSFQEKTNMLYEMIWSGDVKGAKRYLTPTYGEIKEYQDAQGKKENAVTYLIAACRLFLSDRYEGMKVKASDSDYQTFVEKREEYYDVVEKGLPPYQKYVPYLQAISESFSKREAYTGRHANY